MGKSTLGNISFSSPCTCLTATEVDKICGDAVNSPSHYTNGGMEVIDIISSKLVADEFKGYCKGNVLKYLFRYKYKDGVQDLKKARYYLERLIKEEEHGNS